MKTISPVAAVLFAALGAGIVPVTAQDQPAPAAPVQTTPAPLILVVDQNEVVARSLAGRDIAEQVQAYRQKIEAEFGPEQEKIIKEIKQLQEQASVLDPKVREQRQRQLRDRGAALEKRLQERQLQLQGGINKARQEVAQALDPILKEIMIERGGNLLLQKGVVILGAIDVDVTAAAVQRLDQRLPKVAVELVELPKEGGQTQGQ